MLPLIRPIQAEDNPALAQLILTVLHEFGCVGPGYASGDAEVHDMFGYYQDPSSRYWVVVHPDTHDVLGGCGFSRLKGTAPDEAVCELQKFYLYPEARGLGVGRILLSQSIQVASELGYREMYLKTVPAMTGAIRVYEKFGFQHLSESRGNTGHQERCTIRMALLLSVGVVS